MILSRSEIMDYSNRLHSDGKKIVFTNGCFDIIHAGHVFYLNEAKKFGDVLIIGLNSDESVKKLKGESRPLNNESSRAAVLLGLKAVDYVTIFNEDTPFDLITLVKPDVLVKGGDYTFDKIVGADFVKTNGGRVETIPFVHGQSTTAIIEKMKNTINPIIIIIMLILSTFSCSNSKKESETRQRQNTISTATSQTLEPLKKDMATTAETGIKEYTVKVVKVLKHDPGAFTQGLLCLNNYFYEGTGEFGSSSIRKVDIETGKVLQKKSIPAQFFGEGISVINDKIFQLTWLNKTCFYYDLKTFNLLGEFNYDGEGWGLTTDGKSLIMSDGTNNIKYINPENFQIERTLSVSMNNLPVKNLNELEYIKNEIWANIWMTDDIVIINPISGLVTSKIDLAGLWKYVDSHDNVDVLNGIAYDGVNDKIYITGKHWSKMFQIELVEKK